MTKDKFKTTGFIILGLMSLRFFENLLPQPTYAKIFCNFAMPYEENKNYPKAIRYYQKAIYHNPKYPIPHEHLGRIYSLKGNDQRKIKHYKKAAKWGSKNAEVYYELGLYYSIEKNYDLAIDCFEKAVEINQFYLEAHYYLGIAYLKKDLFEKAITCLQNALGIKAQYPEARYHLGIAYLKNGDKTNAQEQVVYLQRLNAYSLAQELERIINSYH